MFTVGLDVDRVIDLCSQKTELFCWESLLYFWSINRLTYFWDNPKVEMRSAGNFRLREIGNSNSREGVTYLEGEDMMKMEGKKNYYK